MRGWLQQVVELFFRGGFMGGWVVCVENIRSGYGLGVIQVIVFEFMQFGFNFYSFFFISSKVFCLFFCRIIFFFGRGRFVVFSGFSIVVGIQEVSCRLGVFFLDSGINSQLFIQLFISVGVWDTFGVCQIKEQDFRRFRVFLQDLVRVGGEWDRNLGDVRISCEYLGFYSLVFFLKK